MRPLIRTVSVLILVLVPAAAAQAKDWRGITPLLSTRGDVTRMLGPAASENDIRAIYEFATEDVYIVFASEWSNLKCVAELPAGTVLLVKVTPKGAQDLTSLPVVREKLKEFDPSEPPNSGYRGYVDEDQGVVIRTLQGKVDQVSYIATKADANRCPDYYRDPKKFVSILIDFR